MLAVAGGLEPRTSEGALRQHHDRFDRLVEYAEKAQLRGNLDLAALYAQNAALHATRFHPGIFASTRLERLCAELSATLAAPAKPSSRAADPGALLDVLTAAYAVGGHSRLAWRWIDYDAARTHSLAVTGQDHRALPTALVEAVRRAHGEIHDLTTVTGGLMARAARLREVAADVDQVVLHVSPYDVLPAIAFASWPDRPPIIYVNHLDLLFWVGVSIADVVVSIDARGARHAIERRGVQPQRSLVLPIPVTVPAGSPSRESARAALRIPPDAVLLLSIGGPHKYAAEGDEPHLLDVVGPVLVGAPSAHLLVAGPEPHGKWLVAARETGGRVRALGSQLAIDQLYAAADIYLDSYPASGGTTVLEAALYGLPMLRLVAHKRLASGMFEQDDVALSEALCVAEDVGAYERELVALLADAQLRRDTGDRAREAISRTHVGDGWRRQLDAVYESAGRLGASPELCERPMSADAVDWFAAEFAEHAGPEAAYWPFYALWHACGPRGRLRLLTWMRTMTIIEQPLSARSVIGGLQIAYRKARSPTRALAARRALRTVRHGRRQGSA